MITGAAAADAAMMLIDAGQGIQQQSRTHAFLLNLLGIRQIIVVVNKMDLVDCSEQRFDAIKTEYTQLSGRASASRPTSSSRPSPATATTSCTARSAWAGTAAPTLVSALDSFHATAS